MAFNIRNVIDVSNQLEGMPPDRKTFGYGLCIAKGTPEAGQVVLGPYTSAEAVAEALGSNIEAVRMANTYFSGGWFGRPFQFYVALVDTETISSLAEWIAGQTYEVGAKIQNDGSAYICTWPHAASGTFSTDMWAVSEEPNETDWAPSTQYSVGATVRVEKESEPSTYTYYTCTYAHTSGATFQQSCWDTYEPTGKPIEEWMTEILQSSQDYYVILPTTEFTTAELVTIAGAVESSSASKLCIETYSGSDALTSGVATDLGSQLKELNYDRTMVVYEPANDSGQVNYVSAAVASGYATVSFTSARPMITMANKPLSGVTSLDLTDPEYSTLQSKGYNFYTKTTDIDTDMFIDTAMASGQFFDTMQAADWLAYDIKYNLVNLVQTRDKIPFTEDGLAMVKQTISETCVAALNAGVIGTGYDNDNNLIENGYLIDMPELSEISQTDKAQRILRDVKVTFLLAGAIQVINVLNDIQL